MDISADVAAIVAQAPEWNFAGDCALLELMKRISQNLQERGERTTQNLNEFESNVRRADIALDNATNSLRSLQFGQQFVEYRVEEVDDDDFAMPEEQNKKPELPPKSAQEMASEFLQNNLQMFRKNFEPMTIEVPDSDDDDEDGAANTTTVFRAKNPYDGIPLPYIIGSKEWQEHKYAGLYDSAENSEDEQPEQFSSSSSDELEAAAPKTTPKRLLVETAQHSDSSSLTSLLQEPAISVDARQALPSTPPPPPLPAARAKAQPRPIISSQRNPHERDLFAALRASPPSDDPPSTSSSLNSSPAISSRVAGAGGLPRMDASLSSSSSSVSKPLPPKLFDEPIKVAAAAPAPVPTPTPLPAPAREEAEVKPAAAASQIKRKPVNLFNDDEFNSFMSEIVDKVQSKSGPNQTPAKTQAQQPAKATETAPVEAQQVSKAVEASSAKKLNLFDESPPLSPISTPAHKPAQVPAKTLPTSLFDDNLDDDDDFLSSFTAKAKPTLQITRTSLFDDDDDDLDIDDIFAKKPKATLPARNPIAKTTLFDDDEEDNVKEIFGAKQQEQQVPIQAKSLTKSTLFDDEEEDGNVKDIFGASKSASQPVKQQQQTKARDVIIPTKTSLFDDEQEDENAKHISGVKTVEPKEEEVVIQAKTTAKSSLFDDDDEDVNVKNIFGAGAAKSTPQKEQPVEIQPKSIVKTSLFDDDDEEDNVKDVFAAKAIATKPQEQQKEQELPPSVQHKSLFDDLGDDDLFGTPKSRKNLSEQRNEIKAVDEEPPEDDVLPEVPKQEQQTVEVPAEQPIKIPKADLFSDDFGDEEQKPEATTKCEITIESKEIAEESKPTPQVKPTNKNEDLEADEEQPPADDVLDDLFGNLSDTQDAAQAAELQQDPIISLVADVTNKKPSNESQEPAKSADIAAAQQVMQNYSSLFSDEPPDDSEFFQSLGTSSLNSLSASKLFDHDQDFFEPSLPALPKTAEQPVEPSNTDYGGMRLFSDVPPEDDGDEQPATAAVQQPSVPAAGGATTKRIHTIFYDDFSETARATPEKQQEPQVDAKPKLQVTKRSSSTDVVDRSLPSSSSELKKPTSPVKKLQMPNININVKALLPGAGTLPKKQMEEQVAEQTKDQTTTQPKVQAKQPVKFSASSADAENILQCVGKTRARGPARRPSTRRARQESYAKSLREQHEPSSSSSPSSSIPNQQKSFERDNIETKPAAPTKQSSVTPSVESDDDDADDVKKMPAAIPVALQPPEDVHQPAKKSSKVAASFLDSDDDDSGFLFSPPNATPAAALKTEAKSTTKSSALKQVSFLDSDEEEPDDAALFSSAKRPVEATAMPNKKPTMMKSFLDSEDEGDALFSSLAKPSTAVPEPERTIIKKVEEKPFRPVAAPEPPKIKANTLFDDSDDDEDLFGGGAAKAAPKSKPALFADSDSEEEAPPKTLSSKVKLPAKPSKSLFSDDEDDDDLFGGGGTKRAKPAQVATRHPPKTNATKQPKQQAKPLASSGSGNSDNPLADLLGP
ncbi:hypothetical protein KR044_001582 [Drosophila immigrans]|nr:hypothetical protein KR044_001582 [Drosophila immigrans]